MHFDTPCNYNVITADIHDIAIYNWKRERQDGHGMLMYVLNTTSIDYGKGYTSVM
jgi:hypothetical protein